MAKNSSVLCQVCLSIQRCFRWPAWVCPRGTRVDPRVTSRGWPFSTWPRTRQVCSDARSARRLRISLLLWTVLELRWQVKSKYFNEINVSTKVSIQLFLEMENQDYPDSLPLTSLMTPSLATAPPQTLCQLRSSPGSSTEISSITSSPVSEQSILPRQMDW